MRLSLTLCVLCILMVMTTIFSGMRFADGMDHTEKMKGIDSATRSLLISLLDAETGQRGYIITGNESYLIAYNAGISALHSKVPNLKAVTSGTLEERDAAEVLLLVKAKVEELAKTIALRRNLGLEAAAEEVNTHLGRNIMDEIRGRLDIIQQWSNRQYTIHTVSSVFYARMSFVTLVIGSILLGIAVATLKGTKL